MLQNGCYNINHIISHFMHILRAIYTGSFYFSLKLENMTFSCLEDVSMVMRPNLQAPHQA